MDAYATESGSACSICTIAADSSVLDVEPDSVEEYPARGVVADADVVEADGSSTICPKPGRAAGEA